MDIFNSPDYKRSRGAYLWYCAFEYFAALLATDAFLAKLLTNIGISDSLAGIIASFVSMSCVFQLLTLVLMRRRGSLKGIIITFDVLHIGFLMCLYLVPFIPVGKNAKTIIVMLCLLTAYVFKYTVHSPIFTWGNSYVEPTKRASYSAKKELVSLFTGMIVSTAAGYVMDKFELANNISGAFLVISFSILIFDICLFICLSLIKKQEPLDKKEKPEKISVTVKNIMNNKNFRNITVLCVLWDISRYFLLGFLGTFKTNDLMLSVFTVQLISVVSCFAKMAVSIPFGKYSDKKGFAHGIKLGLYMSIGSYVAIMFTTNSTWILVGVYACLFNIALSGISQNSANITYSYIDEKYITQAMAIKNCISGVIGFCASLVAAKLLEFIQANGNMLFGIHVYGQQVLAFVSAVMAVIAVIYIKKVIEKQEVMVQ